jgi:hypothetical protein
MGGPPGKTVLPTSTTLESVFILAPSFELMMVLSRPFHYLWVELHLDQSLFTIRLPQSIEE